MIFLLSTQFIIANIVVILHFPMVTERFIYIFLYNISCGYTCLMGIKH